MSIATHVATLCACMPEIHFLKRRRFLTQALAWVFKDQRYIRIYAYFGPRQLGWVYKAWVRLLVESGSFHEPDWRVYHPKTNPPMDPILSEALLPNANRHSKD